MLLPSTRRTETLLAGPRRNVRDTPWAKTCIIVLIAVGAGWLISHLQPSPLAITLLGTLGVLTAPIAWRVARRQFDVFEPIVFFAVAWGVMFVVRPTADLVTNHLSFTIVGRTVDAQQGYEEMLVLGLLGAAAFVAGYVSLIGRRLADRLGPPPGEFKAAVAARNATLVGLVGLVLFGLYLISAGGLSALVLTFSGRSEALFNTFGQSTKYYSFGPYMLVPATVTLLALAAATKMTRYLVVGSAMGTVLVVTQAPIGSRGLLFPLAASGAVYYYLTHRRRPAVKSVVAVFVVALIVSGFLANVRDRSTREKVGVGGTIAKVFSGPGGILDPILYSQDSAEAPALAAALSLIPQEVSHSYGGATLGDLFIRPIPRALWPNKPLPPREQVVAQLFGRLYYRRAANPEFSVLLYPYLDFGWPGVVVFLSLLGVFVRALYEYMLRNVGRLPVRLLFSLALPMLVIGVRDSPVDNLARVVFLVAPVWIMFYPTLGRALLRAGRYG